MVKEQTPDNSLSAHYCILRNFKGLFKKRFLGNTHLYFFPITGDKYVYLGMLGEVEGFSDYYLLDLIVEFDADLLAPLIQGQIEEFGERFSVIESVPCKVVPLAGGWKIMADKKDQYIRSDIIIEPAEGNHERPRYILRGKLMFNH